MKYGKKTICRRKRRHRHRGQTRRRWRGGDEPLTNKPPTDAELDKAGVKVVIQKDGTSTYILPDDQQEEDSLDPFQEMSKYIEKGKEMAKECYEMVKNKATYYFNKFSNLYKNPKAQAALEKVVTNEDVINKAGETAASTVTQSLGFIPIVGGVVDAMNTVEKLSEKVGELADVTTNVVQNMDNDMKEAENAGEVAAGEVAGKVAEVKEGEVASKEPDTHKHKKGGTRRRHGTTSLRQRRRRTHRGRRH
jgi:hypothetical protein